MTLRRPEYKRVRQEIEVAPLAEHAATALASAHLGSLSDGSMVSSAHIASEAGGIPTFVEMLARGARAGMASGEDASLPSLDLALLERVRALSPRARRVLTVIAVADARLPYGVIARASGLRRRRGVRRPGRAANAKARSEPRPRRDRACRASAGPPRRSHHADARRRGNEGPQGGGRPGGGRRSIGGRRCRRPAAPRRGRFGTRGGPRNPRRGAGGAGADFLARRVALSPRHPGRASARLEPSGAPRCGARQRGPRRRSRRGVPRCSRHGHLVAFDRAAPRGRRAARAQRLRRRGLRALRRGAAHRRHAARPIASPRSLLAGDAAYPDSPRRIPLPLAPCRRDVARRDREARRRF